MEKALEIRNLCIEGIRNNFSGDKMSVIDLNCNYCAGADIAINENNIINCYRIAIIKYNPRKKKVK